jgi:hypothetical protein
MFHGNPFKIEAGGPSETLVFITLHAFKAQDTLRISIVTYSVPAFNLLETDIFVALYSRVSGSRGSSSYPNSVHLYHLLQGSCPVFVFRIMFSLINSSLFTTQ